MNFNFVSFFIVILLINFIDVYGLDVNNGSKQGLARRLAYGMNNDDLNSDVYESDGDGKDMFQGNEDGPFRLSPCKYLYVRLDGCSNSQRLFIGATRLGTPLGTYSALSAAYPSLLILPLSVQKAKRKGKYNSLSWYDDQNKRNFIYWFNDLYLNSTTISSKASWFILNPGEPFQIVKRIGKKKYVYNFSADKRSCSNGYLIHPTQFDGKYVLVDRCYN